MSIEPYRYSNGDNWGAEADPTPGPAQVGKAARGRAPNRLMLRGRRARTDPNWANLSPSTRRLLIDLDLKEGHR